MTLLIYPMVVGQGTCLTRMWPVVVLPYNAAGLDDGAHDIAAQAWAAWEAAVCWDDEHAVKRLAEVRAVRAAASESGTRTTRPRSPAGGFFGHGHRKDNP
jgi:hypothetical protein